MYNMIFGMNKAAPLLLAALGLTPQDVGRFRDAFVTEGRIAVYTRNGGGNRHCWHEEYDSGDERCTHHTEQREVQVWERTPVGQIEVSRPTDQFKTEEVIICDVPNSPECYCVGCTARYRLPAHPLYIEDRDDDFDSTYATFFFSIPEPLVSVIAPLESGPFNPDERWLASLDALKGMPREELEQRYPTFVKAVQTAVEKVNEST